MRCSRPSKRAQAALLAFSGALALPCAPVSAQDTHVRFNTQQIAGPDCLQTRSARDGGYAPCTQEEYRTWLRDATHWRDERRIRSALSDARYRDPALAWTQRSFIQAQAMVHDRYLYDAATGRYTASRYLNDVHERYDGLDAVLLWPTYPNLGIDDRNQQEMILSMPGGAAGLHELIASFHEAGVKVLLPIMPWDQGTSPPSEPWPQATAKLMKLVNADGVNGDTMHGVPLAYALATENIGHPLAFEPEQTPDDEALSWDIMTWGQYEYPFVPMVDRFKWLEPRHMVNISDRWRRDRRDNLQFAFFNGVGWESWENIWGIWNGISPRDGEATRRIATLERELAPYLVSDRWQPFFPTIQFGVFSSRWPGSASEVFTLVNRNDYDVSGEQLRLPFAPGRRFFDLYRGVELRPSVAGDTATLSFDLEAKGFGAIGTLDGEASDSGFLQVAAKMKALAGRTLGSYQGEAAILRQHLIEEPASPHDARSYEDMVLIPAATNYIFDVHGLEVEGGNDPGVDVQYPWEDVARRFHHHNLAIAAFYLDRTPVTNETFLRFLKATGYRPTDPQNFLRNWNKGQYPEGAGKQPVTWVSREDAQAFARWAGKRLPHEWEWQYAAQGEDGRRYPWGNIWKAEAVPTAQKGRHYTHPDDVEAHPAGASPFGVLDMTGNVWQWTDAFEDEHTRFAVLRGGSAYQPQGSAWYFPQAYANTEHGKYLLMAPAMDRAATLGFRCAADAPSIPLETNKEKE